MNQRLINESAHSLTQDIAKFIEQCLHEGGEQELCPELFQICKQHLEAYGIQQDRMQHRLQPLRDFPH
jgi:hypothetical protein